ncbi:MULTISPECIES: hypothetical protein [Bacillus cereus group]|uniref:hypothetical protein n=1 Tax=Bacillus cereus group TaxID=86661 RepID=UPI001873CE70|nr:MULTISPECIES: hypothetical protein [Bacillus cereus group]MBE4941950.1 hypothetical protein [Bacillus thuringiensis]MED2794865.1 hypothetical protein [Bacillus wiedmannii]HDR7713661.1 hypothetical protein [Bacillus cereus]
MTVKDVKITGELTERIFLEEKMGKDAKKTLLAFFAEHILHGANGIIDDETGNTMVFQFTKGKTFPVPVVPFIDFERGRIDIDELLVYVYLCYVVHTSKNSNVKIRVDMISKRTGLSKKKVKDVLNSLYEKETYIKDLGKGMIDVYLLSSKLLSDLELAKELHEKSELEGGDSTPIPRELMENYHKYDLSNTELAIVLMFMSYAYKGTYTYEEIIKEIIEKHPETPEFQIQSAVRKAENHGFFKLVKLSNGNTQLIYED